MARFTLALLATTVVWLALLTQGVGRAAEAASDLPPTAALKYHKALRRRPAPGYLFNRFVDTWVDEGTSESLEKFLRDRAEDSGPDGLLLAYFYTKQGDDLRAIEQFRRTLEAEPGNAVAWYQKAVVEARSLDFETALSDLKSATDAGPDEEQATRIAKLRGKLLVRSGKRDEALAAFRELVAARPGDEELAEDVIELLVEENLYEEAAKLSAQLIERTKDPYRKVLRRLRLGDIRQQAGDQTAAVTLYADVLSEVGAGEWLEREVLSQIERVYRREEDTGGLKEQYQKLCDRYPRRVAVLKGRARVLADSGDGKAALAKFREVLAITPGDRANQQEFVQLHVRTGDFAGAREQLDTLIDLYQKDAELQIQVAEVSAKLKDSERVESAVDRYLELSDKSEYAYQRAARLLDRFERPAVAKVKYALLTEAFPDSRSAKEARAGFLYKSGDKADAIELWLAAADGGDAQQVVRVSKTLASRLEHDAAHDLLKSRADEFASDPLYLAQAVAGAIAVEEYDEAVTVVRRRITLAEAPAELESAVAQAAKAIERAKKVPTLIYELQGVASPTSQQACLLAELHDRNGDPQRADAVLESWVADGNLLAVSQQVRLARSRRDWDAAADAAKRMLDLPDGRNSRNLRRLVELLERAFRTEDALKRIPEWKRLSPGSSSPWLTEARLLSIEGKPDEAREVLRQASRQLADPRDVRTRLAQLYTESGQLADAERIYWRDYQDSEDLSAKVRAVEQIARVCERQGKTPALVADFEERKRENRDSIEPLMALAAIHRVTGDQAKRIQVLGEAAKLRPDDLQLLALIARAQEGEGDWEAARDTLARAAESDPTPRTKQNLARLLIRWGETDAGYAVLRELVSSETDDPRELEKVADAMAGAGDWGQSINFLMPLVQQFEKDYRLSYLLGVALEEDDRLAEAADVFLSVLKLDREVGAGTKGSAASRSVSNWYGSAMEKIAPPGSMEFFTATQQRHSAYSHRQNRGNQAYFVGGGGGARATVNLPQTLKFAHGLALTHLGQIADSLEDKQAEALREMVAEGGPPQADAILALQQGSTGFQMEIDYESLGDFVKRPVVRAYLTFSGSRMQDLPAEFFVETFEEFEADYPELALIAALNGIGRAESEAEADHPLLAGALRLLKQIDKPTNVTLMNVCQWRTGAGINRPVDPPKELTEALSDWIVRRIPDTNLPQGLGSYLFTQIAAILRESEDPAAYIDLLENEVQRQKDNSAAGRTAGPVYFRNPQSSLIAAPTFPPLKLQNVPATVLSLLRSVNGNAPIGAYVRGGVGKVNWTEEAFRQAIDGVKDTTLRLLLAHSAEDKVLVEAAMQELLAVDPPELDAFLLAAGIAASEEKPKEAIRLLTRARFLPMNREDRRQIDGQLVALVQGLAESEETDKELMQTGRDAALRLRHGRLDANLRTQLASALEDFGLGREAERLERAGTTTSGGARAIVSGVMRPQAASTDQIQRMIAAGKTKAAAKRIAQDLRAAVQQVSQNPWNRSHYARQARDRIAGYGLLKEAFRELDPGDSTSHRRHAEYAETLMLFGKPDQAASAYRRTLKLRPNEDAYRVKLMLAELASDDGEAAEAHIPDLGREGAAMLAAEVSASFHDYECPLDSRLDQIELVVAAFEHAVKQPKAEVSWASRFRQGVASSHHSNRGSGHLNSLFSEKTNGQSEAFATRRRELHERLCQAMIKPDETVCDAVAALWATAEAADELGETNGPLTQKLLVLAAEAVTRHRPIRSVSQAFTRVPMRSSQNEKTRQKSPAELLVRQASQTENWSVVDDVQARLESGGDPTMRRALHTLRNLYECPEADFTEVADDLVRSWRIRNTPAPGGENRPEMAVLDCYLQRGLRVEIEPFFLDLLKRSPRQGGNLPSALLDYASHLTEQQGSEAATVWLEKIAVEVICPRAKRAAFVSQHYSQGGWSHNSPNGQIHMFEQMLNQATQRSELVLPVARFLSEAELGTAGSDAIQMLNGRLSINKPESADAVLTFLEETNLLSEAGNLLLAPISSGAVGKGPSIFELASKSLNRVPESVKQEVRDSLSAREEQTLGVCLVLDALSKPSDQLHAITHTAENLERLQALPEEQRRRVAEQVADTLASVRNRLRTEVIETKPEVATAIEWLDAENDQTSVAITETLKSINKFEELGVQGHRLDEWVASTLSPLVKRDPGTAATFYIQVCRLYDEAMQRGGVSMYYKSTALELLPRMSWRWRNEVGEDSVGLVELAIALHAQNTVEAKFALGAQDLRQVFEPLNRKWQALSQESRDDGGLLAAAKRYLKWSGPLATAKSYYEWLDSGVRGSASPLLAESHLQIFAKLSLDDLQRIVTWLDEELESDAPTNAPLAREIRAAAGVVLERYESGKKATEFSQLPGRIATGGHYEHYAAVLAEEEVSLGIRTALAATLYNARGRRLPTEVAHALANAATAACSASYRLDDSAELSFCKNAYFLVADDPTDPAAEAFLERWTHRYVTTRPKPTSGKNYPRSVNEAQSLDGLLMLIATRCLRDEADQAEKVLGRYRELLQGRHEVIGLLTRHDRLDEAARLARASWSKLPLSTSPQSPVVYDRQLEEHAPALYEKLKGPVAYLIEAALARLPDAPEGPDQPSMNREERMVAVAKRFDTSGITTSTMVEAALVLFHESDAATDVLGERLTEVATKLSLPPLAQSGGGRLEKAGALKRQHAKWAARRGDVGPVLALVAELTSVDRNSNWQLWGYLQRYQSELYDALLDCNEDQMTEVAETARGMIEKSTDRSGDISHLVTFVTVAHVRFGRAAEYEAWFETLDERPKQMIRQRGLGSRNFGVFLGKIDKDDPKTLQTRIKLVTQLLSIGETTGWINSTGQGWPMLVSNGGRRTITIWSHFFTEEEIPEAVMAVAEQSGQSKRIAWELAGLKLEQSERYADATRAWEVAYRAVEGKELVRWRYGVKWVDALLADGRIDAARERYEAILAEKTPVGPARKPYDRLLKRIDAAVAKANKAESADSTDSDDAHADEPEAEVPVSDGTQAAA